MLIWLNLLQQKYGLKMNLKRDKMKNSRYYLVTFLLLLFISPLNATAVRKDHQLLKEMKKNHIRLVVMRHGEALHNLTHLMTSSRSPGIYLTENGIQQVQHAAEELAKERIASIYVSPIYRTLQTAQIVNLKLNLPFQKIIVEEKLREQFFGEFENGSYLEYEGYFPKINDVFFEAVPGGESGKELYTRTRELLWKIVKDENNNSQTLLLITHGFNSCQISKCLSGSFGDFLGKAEFTIYE